MADLCRRFELNLQVWCLNVFPEVKFFNKRKVIALAVLFDLFNIALPLEIAFNNRIGDLHLEAIGALL